MVYRDAKVRYQKVASPLEMCSGSSEIQKLHGAEISDVTQAGADIIHNPPQQLAGPWNQGCQWRQLRNHGFHIKQVL